PPKTLIGPPRTQTLGRRSPGAPKSLGLPRGPSAPFASTAHADLVAGLSEGSFRLLSGDARRSRIPPKPHLHGEPDVEVFAEQATSPVLGKAAGLLHDRFVALLLGHLLLPPTQTGFDRIHASSSSGRAT